jgi:hypothetical protein
MKVRRKPIIFEAEQFCPQTNWVKSVIAWDTIKPRDMSFGYIQTLEGKMHVQAGDWIITGVKGEQWACAPDVFEMTYEKINIFELLESVKTMEELDALRKESYEEMSKSDKDRWHAIQTAFKEAKWKVQMMAMGI